MAFRPGTAIGNLDLPEDSYLPGTCTKFPYIMVGDAAFPIKHCIMLPLSGLYTYLNFCLTSVIIFFSFAIRNASLT